MDISNLFKLYQDLGKYGFSSEIDIEIDTEQWQKQIHQNSTIDQVDIQLEHKVSEPPQLDEDIDNNISQIGRSFSANKGFK